MIQPTLALPRPGTLVPQFAYGLSGGGELKMPEMRDQPTVLFLWSTHCPTSRQALTGYRELHREFVNRGVRVVMLSDDESDEERALLPKVLSDSGIVGELAMARGQLARTFDLSSIAPERDTARVEFVLPAYFVVGRDGRVITRAWGPDPAPVRVTLDSLLGAKPGPA